MKYGTQGRSRNGTADLIKGFAVLFMIQVHIMEQLATQDTFHSLIGKISLFLGGPPCAPAFMAVMGYFLALSSKPLSYFVKRGIFLFILGIALNTARSANLLIGIYHGKILTDPWFYILGADILPLAGLSLIITGLIRRLFKENFILYLFLAAGIAIVSPVITNSISTSGLLKYLLAFFRGPEAWSYFPIFPWYSYVLSGYAFSLLVNRTEIFSIPEVSRYYLYFFPLVIFVVLTIPYAAGIAHNLTGTGGYYHHGPLYFSWILIFMLVYLVLVDNLEKHFGKQILIKGIKWMGKEVTLIYIIQWLIIGNIATVLYQSRDLLQATGWFLGVTALSVLITYLVTCIRKKVRIEH